MFRVPLLRVVCCLSACVIFSTTLRAQEDLFRWIDFHSQKDQDVVTWVARALDGTPWTAIREIGVEYDAALVVTTLRASPLSSPNNDELNVWSVSLTNRKVTPILKGANLRWFGWMSFSGVAAPEPIALYDNCTECSPETYFTSFYYDYFSHAWAARWMQGGHAVPLFSANTPPGVVCTEVHAVMADSSGRGVLATWNNYDYQGAKPTDDYVYKYDVDPATGRDRVQPLTGKDADSMKARLCMGRDAVPKLSRGQNSSICKPWQIPEAERHVTTTPPANNQGKSNPGQRH